MPPNTIPTSVQPVPSTVNASYRKQNVDLRATFNEWSGSGGVWSSEYYAYFMYTPLSVYQQAGGWPQTDIIAYGYDTAGVEAGTWHIKIPYWRSNQQTGGEYYGQSPYTLEERATPWGDKTGTNWQYAWAKSGQTNEVAQYYAMLDCDRTYMFRAATEASSTSNSGGTFPAAQCGPFYGDTIQVKTNPAAVGTATTPSVSSITFNSAIVNAGTFTPNTYESGVTVKVQYKKQADTLWIDAITYSSQTGYSPIAYGPVSLTGLSQVTLYNVRVYGSRLTNPNDTFVTSEIAFTTLAASPDITTGAATSVGATSAALNATIDSNGISTTVSFVYGTSNGGPYGTEVGGQVFSTDGAQSYSFPLTGLTSGGQSYYYKAKAVYGSENVTIYGDQQSFATLADPLEAAKKEDLMLTTQFEGQYGTAKTITFTLKPYSTSSSDVYYQSTAPTQAEVSIYHTTAAGVTTVHTALGAGIDYAPARPGSGLLYAISLSADEMSADIIDVIIRSAGTAFRDQHLQIRTSLKLTNIDLDATNGPSPTVAFNMVGKGSGAGFRAVGGATGIDFDAIIESQWLRVFSPAGSSSGDTITLTGATGATDLYVGNVIAVVGGGLTAGQGQSRVITAYNATTNVCTVDTPWTTTVTTDAICVVAPGARVWDMKPTAGTGRTATGELSDVPDPVDSYGKYLQLLFQRFAFKIEQEAQSQTWFNSTDTAVFSRTVDDDGSRQIIEKLANI